MIGGNGYECTWCPLCGELVWNGQCENIDCSYHWHPMNDEEQEND